MAKEFSKVFHRKFGQRLRYLRLERKMTQEELSLEIGTDNSYISQIENAKADIPLSRLRQIASALKVKLIELLDF